jgi:ammonia channel protein AmtB
MAQHFGAPAAVLFCGVASIACAGIFSLRRRDLKIDDQLAISSRHARADASV